MSEFSLAFNVAGPFKELDEFALLACQNYNLGNGADWFGNFRGGLYGFYARLHGVDEHYRLIHGWMPDGGSPTKLEYHLASIFFNMDSALECLAFAMNGLGVSAAPAMFRDITDRKALKGINPKDVVGARSGYAVVFPLTQALWQQKRTTIDRIVELHDASKHRHMIFTGGNFQNAPGTVSISRMSEILLTRDPKQPHAQRTSAPYDKDDSLEVLGAEFVDLINRTATALLADARANIKLRELSFRA